LERVPCINSQSTTGTFITSFLFILIIMAQALTAHAFTVDINVDLIRSTFNIQENENPVFILNRDTGEVIFGDGVTGEGLPSGTQNIVGTYRTNGEGEGNVLNAYIISHDGSSIFVPLSAFPVDDSEKSVLSFIVSGINYFTLEITGEGVNLTNVEFTPIPEPATMVLLGSGLLGLWGFRRKFKK